MTSITATSVNSYNDLFRETCKLANVLKRLA
jgi:hypothetical protein